MPAPMDLALIDLAEMMVDIDPVTVDNKMAMLHVQRANRKTNCLLIGRPISDFEDGSPKIFPVHKCIITKESSFFQELCARPPQSSPIPAHYMNSDNQDIERLIDFMYLGIYGADAITGTWRRCRYPSVYIHVRMYRMGTRFGIPSLERFADEAIFRTYPIADRQDLEYAINEV